MGGSTLSSPMMSVTVTLLSPLILPIRQEWVYLRNLPSPYAIIFAKQQCSFQHGAEPMVETIPMVNRSNPDKVPSAG